MSAGRSYGGESPEDRASRRRRQLLDAGLEVFGTHGYRQATVRQLCREAKVADRYFYEQFDHAEDLLLAVYDECTGRLEQAVLAAVADLDAAGVLAPEPSTMDRMLESGGNPFLLDDASDFDAFYAMTMAKPPFMPGFVEDALAQGYVERRDELTEIFRGFHHRGLLDDRLAEITAPAYVMWGSEDQLVDPSAAQVWVAGLPDATEVVYDGIGHMPMVEIPEESARDYRKFLEGLG